MIASLFDLLGILAEHSAGEPVLGIVRQLQRMIEIARLGHRQHRPKISSWKIRALESISAITVG
jgi:hypothetical protein